MTTASTLAISVRASGVAQVTMARPAVFNAFDEAMIAELDATIERLEADPSVRVIVLAGEGKHFSAGADLQWMQRASTASEDWNRRVFSPPHGQRCRAPAGAVVGHVARGAGSDRHRAVRHVIVRARAPRP